MILVLCQAGANAGELTPFAAFDAAGQLLVADTGNDRIVVFDQGTLVASLWGGFRRPEGVAVHPNGRVYATGAWSGNIVAFQDGEPVALAAGLSAPHDVALDAGGNLWVADAGNDRMVLFSAALERLAVLDAPEFGWSEPRYLDVDAAGNLIVADKYSHSVKLVTPDGRLSGAIGGALGCVRTGSGPPKGSRLTV